MMKTWESYIRRVEPYVPGEQPKILDIVKLNTNENPYPPSPKAVLAAKDFDYDRLRLYPDPEASLLVSAIANNYQVDESQVFVGVGSDDVIAMAFMTFFNSKLPILFPDVSYSFYSVWADLFKVPYETVPLNDDFEIVPDTYRKANGGIIFPNPNAPTSVYLGLESVEEIVRNNTDSVVIVDEAYIDFGGESAVKLTERYDNLLVVQTYSKSRSMAGMRIGYAIGSTKLISAMRAVKFSYNSYTMNQTSLVYGKAAMEDSEYFESCVNRIVNTRETAKRELAALGFIFPDSKANFIFASHKYVPAQVLFEGLKERKIYVRYFNKPKIDNYLRITVGTDEEMNKLYAALKEIIDGYKG